MKKIEEIWFEYHNKLYTFIRSRVAENEAEDILQDVFCKISTRIDSLKEKTRLQSWLYQITRNAVIDYYRSKKNNKDFTDWVEQTQFEENEDVKRELSSCFIPMINQLPDKYRAAINLSEIEGKTQKEVAELEKISLSGAKSRVQRGRALLKSMLTDCCQIEVNHNNQLISCEKKEQECKLC
jgi:RNA polymerase sigma-70 factor (ECF subfamily)